MANYNPGFKGTTKGLLKGAATSAAKRSGAVTTTVSEFKKLQDEIAKLKDKGFYFELKRNPDTGVTKLRFANGLTGLRKQYAPTLESINEIAADIKKTKATQAYKDFATVKRGVPEKIKRQTQLSLEKARDPSRIEAEIRRLKKGLVPNYQLHHLAGKDELTKLNNLKLLPTNLNTADDVIRAEQNIIDLNKETNLILDQAKISKNDKIRLNQLNALKKRIKNKDLKGQLKGLKSMDIISFDKDGNVIKKSVGADIKMKTTGAGTEVGEIAFSDIVSKTDPRRLDVLNMATAEIAKEIEASGDPNLIKTFQDRLKKSGLVVKQIKENLVSQAKKGGPICSIFGKASGGTVGGPCAEQMEFAFDNAPEQTLNDIAKVNDPKLKTFAQRALSIFPKLGTPGKIAAGAVAGAAAIGALTYNKELGEFVNPLNDDKASQATVTEWIKDNPIKTVAGTSIGFSAQEIPGAYKKARELGRGRTRSALGITGALKPVLTTFGTPAMTALFEVPFSAKRLEEGETMTEVLTDPLGPALGLTFMEPLSKGAGVIRDAPKRTWGQAAKGYFDLSNVGKARPGITSKILRMGLSPRMIAGASRFLGLPGLALSLGLTGYDAYKNYQNQEGMWYNLLNRDE